MYCIQWRNAFFVQYFKQLLQIKKFLLSLLAYLRNSLHKVSFFINYFINYIMNHYNQSWIRILVAIAVIYLFTVELFPTTMRSTGFACCNIIARFAMTFLPLVLSTSSIAAWLPVALMGIISTLGAFSTILLPDTKGLDLMDNLEDAENFYSDHKLSFCCYWSNLCNNITYQGKL